MRPMRRAFLLIAAAVAGCSQPTPSAEQTSAPAASAAAATAAATAVGSPQTTTPFHCFAWTHNGQSSTDCYRSAAACDLSKGSLDTAGRSTQPCFMRTGASCTQVTRNPNRPSQHERCFPDAAACARYKQSLEGSPQTSTPCEDR